MAQSEVYMNIPEVQGIAKTFGNIADTLNGVAKALEVLINILYSTAFIGMVGGLAQAHFLEIMKRQLEQMADKCEELSQDVSAAVEAYERGDAAGATKFY